MSGIVLRLKVAPALRVDMRGITPHALAGLSREAIGRVTVWHGNEATPLAEWFAVDVGGADGAAPTLRLAGDLSRFDRIGTALDGGRIEIESDAGDYVGASMTAGEIRCRGSAGLFAGCEMAGGTVHVEGDVGDFAAAALPGSMDGMRGGELLVGGHAGQRLGDRMRRGLVAIAGDAGDFAASRMVAGTIAVGGRLGAHAAFGMRRGTLLLVRARPRLSPTFVPTTHDITVFWRLLALQLRSAGAPFAALGGAPPRRLAGDLAVDGKGEVLYFD